MIENVVSIVVTAVACFTMLENRRSVHGLLRRFKNKPQFRWVGSPVISYGLRIYVVLLGLIMAIIGLSRWM